MIIKNIPLVYEVVYSAKRKRCVICSLRHSLLLWIINLPLLSLICSRHPSLLPSETLIPSLFRLFLIMTKSFPYYCTSLLFFSLLSFWVFPSTFRNIYYKLQSCCFCFFLETVQNIHTCVMFSSHTLPSSSVSYQLKLFGFVRSALLISYNFIKGG